MLPIGWLCLAICGFIPYSMYPSLNEDWELQEQPKEIVGVRKLLNGTEQVLVIWITLILELAFGFELSPN